MPLAAKVAVADFVIENTGTPGDLRRRADEVLLLVCDRLRVDGTRYRTDLASS